MKFKTLLLALCMVAVSSSANATAKNYVRLEGGYAFPTALSGSYNNFNRMTPESSFIAGLSAGRDANEYVALELSYNYFNRFDFDKQVKSAVGVFEKTRTSFSANTIMSNIKLTPCHKYKVRPFITAGVGISFNEMDDYVRAGSVNPGKTVTSAAYNAGTGLDFELGDSLNVSLAYKYFHLGKFNSNPLLYDLGTNQVNGYGAAETKLKVHSVILGLSYKF